MYCLCEIVLSLNPEQYRPRMNYHYASVCHCAQPGISSTGGGRTSINLVLTEYRLHAVACHYSNDVLSPIIYQWRCISGAVGAVRRRRRGRRGRDYAVRRLPRLVTRTRSRRWHRDVTAKRSL